MNLRHQKFIEVSSVYRMAALFHLILVIVLYLILSTECLLENSDYFHDDIRPSLEEVCCRYQRMLN